MDDNCEDYVSDDYEELDTENGSETSVTGLASWDNEADDSEGPATESGSITIAGSANEPEDEGEVADDNEALATENWSETGSATEIGSLSFTGSVSNSMWESVPEEPADEVADDYEELGSEDLSTTGSVTESGSITITGPVNEADNGFVPNGHFGDNNIVFVRFCMQLQFPLLWLFHTLFGNVKTELCPVYENVLCDAVTQAGGICWLNDCVSDCAAENEEGENYNNHQNTVAWDPNGNVDVTVVAENNLDGTVGCFKVCPEIHFTDQAQFMEIMGIWDKAGKSGSDKWTFTTSEIWSNVVIFAKAVVPETFIAGPETVVNGGYKEESCPNPDPDTTSGQYECMLQDSIDKNLLRPDSSIAYLSAIAPNVGTDSGQVGFQTTGFYCEQNNGGCSHICTGGGYNGFCECPNACWELDSNEFINVDGVTSLNPDYMKKCNHRGDWCSVPDETGTSAESGSATQTGSITSTFSFTEPEDDYEDFTSETESATFSGSVTTTGSVTEPEVEDEVIGDYEELATETGSFSITGSLGSFETGSVSMTGSFTGSVSTSVSESASEDFFTEDQVVIVTFCVQLQFPLLWLFHTLFSNVEDDLCPVYQNTLCDAISQAGGVCWLRDCGFNCAAENEQGQNANNHENTDPWDQNGDVDQTVVTEDNLDSTVGCFKVCPEMHFADQDQFLLAMNFFRAKSHTSDLPGDWTFTESQILVSLEQAAQSAVPDTFLAGPDNIVNGGYKEATCQAYYQATCMLDDSIDQNFLPPGATLFDLSAISPIAGLDSVNFDTGITNINCEQNNGGCSHTCTGPGFDGHCECPDDCWELDSNEFINADGVNIPNPDYMKMCLEKADDSCSTADETGTYTESGSGSESGSFDCAEAYEGMIIGYDLYGTMEPHPCVGKPCEGERRIPLNQGERSAEWQELACTDGTWSVNYGPDGWSDSGGSGSEPETTFDDCSDTGSLQWAEVDSSNMHCIGQPCGGEKSGKSEKSEGKSFPPFDALICTDGVWETSYVSYEWSVDPSYTGSEPTYSGSSGCVHGAEFQEECLGQPCEGEPKGPIWLEFQVFTLYSYI